MSGTIDVPKGLDGLTKEEIRLMEAMRSDEDAGGDDPQTEAREPEPAAREPAEEDREIDLEPAHDEPVRSKTVPHQQFHAERERRKAAEAKAAALEAETAAKMATLQERLNTITAVAQVAVQQPPPPPPVEDPLPDVTVDPVGYFSAVDQRRQQEMESLKGMLTSMQQERQRVAEVQALQRWASSQELAFEAQEAGYRDAMRHLENSRRAELTAIGVTDPAQQAQIIGQDIHAIAVRAQQEGANFPARLFGLAQHRGYAKAAPAAPAIPPMDATPPPAMDHAARIQAGRDNSTTIGTAGAAPATRLSVAKIADMNETQFAALLKSFEGNPAALRQLMGE